MISKNTDKEQPNNPLHGVKLAEILQYLIATYGWEELSLTIKINCFKWLARRLNRNNLIPADTH